ncbi:MAG: tetratricopeptide repeat protein [Myxococcales bacterium]|nr:tetratricopeptide repeat protein [Myxococcales bacterium]
MSLSSLVRLALLSGLLWVLGTAPADAQEAATYDAQIEQALAEFERGNWAEARGFFLKAHRQLPTARTARGLGIVSYEMRRYVESVRWLQEALSLKTNALTAPQRAEVERTLALANDYIGRFRLDVKPADASLRVNGAPAELQEDGSLWLDVGEHVLEASAPGHVKEARELVVEGGEEQQLELHLDKHQPAPTGAMLPTAAADDGSVFGEWWFWTAAVVVIGGGVAGTLLLTQEDEVQPLLPGDDGVTVRALTIR